MNSALGLEVSHNDDGAFFVRFRCGECGGLRAVDTPQFVGRAFGAKPEIPNVAKILPCGEHCDTTPWAMGEMKNLYDVMRVYTPVQRR